MSDQPDYYWIEVDGKPEPCGLQAWAVYQNSPARWLATDELEASAYGRPVRLTTIFIGVDLSWGSRPEPLLYGTGLLPQPGTTSEWLHASREAALAFHAEALELLRAGKRVRCDCPLHRIHRD